MRKIITLLTIVFSIPVFGQNHFVGLKGGMNWTNANTSNFISSNDNRTGYHGGLTYEYRLSNHFSGGIDFLYIQKGFTNEVIFTDELGIPTGEKIIDKFNYDYLSFPIKGGFFIGDRITGFVNLGLVPSILISAKLILPGIEGLINDKTIDMTDKVTKFDFGGLIEIGGSYKLYDRFLIFSSIGYQQSFTTITNSDYFSDSKIKHNGITLSIGIKYSL